MPIKAKDEAIESQDNKHKASSLYDDNEEMKVASSEDQDLYS
jgi:hypothetical protein